MVRTYVTHEPTRTGLDAKMFFKQVRKILYEIVYNIGRQNAEL